MRGRGLGDIGANQINQIATVGASTTVGILAGLHAVIGGIAFAGPVGAAIAGLIAVGSLVASMFHGCGQTCVEATAIVNQVEPALAQNRDTYLQAPVRYKSMQQAALNNFDTVWNAVQHACSDPQLQDAGKRCISDRQAGACKWRKSGGVWQGTTWIPWGTQVLDSGGNCFNWFSAYRDPIANDPSVLPDPTTADQVSADLGGALSAVGINPSMTLFGIPLSTLALPAAILLAVWLVED